MQKTIYVKGILLFSFGLLILSVSCRPKNKADKGKIVQGQKPNIMLFLGDDMTWSDCSPYGNSEVRTPNIQRLADEGMCFDNMFTSTAMCAPSRQQILTGLFPVRSGAFPNHSEVYDGVKSLGHYFGDLGYEVALVGKQHYGPDASFPIQYLGGRHHDDGKNGADIDVSKLTPIINGKKPFFIIIAQNQPHTPWNRGNTSYYDPDSLTVPQYMVDTEKTREGLVRYYAEITYADSLLGKVIDEIEISGKEKNTISIFTSEQGYSYPFGKWTNYDLGLKTAFIMKWPGKITPGSRNAAMAQYVDVVPTLLEMVGGSPEKIHAGIADANGNTGLDGHSFYNVLNGAKAEHRDVVYGVQTTRGIYSGSESYPIRSARSKKYKYIQNLNHESNFYNMVVVRKNGIYKDWLAHADESMIDWVKTYKKRPFEELYDLEVDPFEKNNLALRPEVGSIKQKLKRQLESWMHQQGDVGQETEMMALGRQQGDMGKNWKSYLQEMAEKH